MEKVYIAAGGTGGHINAALSVGEEFSSDFDVHYVSGLRYLDIKLFANVDVTHIKSQPLRTKNPIKLSLNLLKNFYSFFQLYWKFLTNRPKAVIGAGGYVCGPTLMAAKLLLIPIFIIEQNAVMGLTNRLLAKVANLIFLNFKNTKGLVATDKKIRVVGNPIRREIQFPKALESNTLNILIFGGSLGAAQINEVIFQIIERGFEFPVKIVHQVGKDGLKNIQVPEGIAYEQLEYIDDMQQAYANSHIIIARSGASTVSELRVVKRPTIIIPFPHATDNHQYYNALNLKEENLFPVEILDYNKSVDELSQEVYDALIRLRNARDWERVSASSETPAAELIKNEILSYVRNK